MTRLVDETAVTVGEPVLAHDAASAAGRAASRAACEVRELATLDELNEAIVVLRRVWGRADEADIVPIEMLRALSHSGNYAAGAFCSGRMAGAVVGFLGEHDGRVHLHSHVMGLVAERRSRGMGFALKLHQRAWALARGIGTVTWTFDPLVRRNAYFNLTKLGAEATDYHADFYGDMDDALNGGDATDRLLATWSLDSPRVVAASRGHAASRDAFDDHTAATLLEADERGRPVIRRAEGQRVRCHVPEDIVTLRQHDPGLARAWRLALRETLGAMIRDGHHAIGVTRDGWYVLEPRTDRPRQT